MKNQTTKTLLKRLTPVAQAKFKTFKQDDRELAAALLSKYHFIGDMPIGSAITMCYLFEISTTELHKFYFLFK
mgnify:FL=1|jgi:hypothetical protein